MIGVKIAHGGVCCLPVYDPIFRGAVELQAGIFIHAWLLVGGDPFCREASNELTNRSPRT
jgi:hypothetical protein